MKALKIGLLIMAFFLVASTVYAGEIVIARAQRLFLQNEDMTKVIKELLNQASQGTRRHSCIVQAQAEKRIINVVTKLTVNREEVSIELISKNC